MSMLQAGVAPEVIALWLGHESPTTTHLYVEADVTIKAKGLNQIQSPLNQKNPFPAQRRSAPTPGRTVNYAQMLL